MKALDDPDFDFRRGVPCTLVLHVTADDIERSIQRGLAADEQGAVGLCLRQALVHLDAYTGRATPLGRRKVRLRRLEGDVLTRWFRYEITARARYNVERLPPGSQARDDYWGSTL